MRQLVLALLASATALAASAQTTDREFPRAYMGLGAASADHDYSIRGLSNIDADGFDTSVRVFGGYEFDRIWGVEAGYTDFTRSDFSFVQNNRPGTGDGDGYGVYVAGKARYPLAPQWEVLGKLGIAYSHRNVNTTTGIHFNDDDTGVYAGVGLQWNVHPQWALTAEYERYGKSKDNGAKADVFTVGLRYNF
jgi:OOP family OmpA-OmpF porin